MGFHKQALIKEQDAKTGLRCNKVFMYDSNPCFVIGQMPMYNTAEQDEEILFDLCARFSPNEGLADVIEVDDVMLRKIMSGDYEASDLPTGMFSDEEEEEEEE